MRSSPEPPPSGPRGPYARDVDWLREAPWVLWLVLAALLGVAEIATLDLLFLMLAAGAAAGAVTAGIGAPFLAQALAALAVSVGMLGVVRPVALRHLRSSAPGARTGIEALVGREALVLERVDAHTGRIKLAGEVWSARAYDVGPAIEPGRTVHVVTIEGATAVVYPSDSPSELTQEG